MLRSPLLYQAGFRHGFSLRTGGVSAAPFDTLNLARNLGDDPQAVAENHARLAAEVGYDPTALYEVSQVHGAAVHRADAAVAAPQFRQREGDAVCALARDLAVGVRVADCVPVLLASPETGAVAAVHAGWRGVAARVIGASVAVLCRAAHTGPERLLSAVGPHIGPDAFEVSVDVAAQLAASVPSDPAVVLLGQPRPHVDLARAVRAQLLEAGLTDRAISRVPGCTWAEPARFFSYRRDGQASGRHLAVIVAGC